MNRPHIHHVGSWADLADAVVTAEQAGAIGLATLMRALHCGRIAFLPMLPETPASKFKVFAARTRLKPAITLIGDDDYCDRGPGGWPIAGRASRWAAAVLLHAAGATRGQYLAAIEAAEQLGRILIIECSTVTLPAWAELVAAAPQRPRVLVIAPTVGAHPVMPTAEAMH